MAEDPNVNRTGLFTKPYFTVTTLPTASGQQGQIQHVTDANSNAAVDNGEIVVGGGNTRARVISDGTNWRLYGWV